MRLKRVNLIPKNILKRSILKTLKDFDRENRKLRRLAITILLFISVIIAPPLLALHIYKRNVVLTKRAMENAKAKLKKSQSQNLQFEKLKTDLKKEETRLKERLGLLLSNSSKNGKYFASLMLISELLPQDLWISRLIANENEIQLSGSALKSQQITDFMNKLDASKDFKNTHFVSSEKQMVASQAVYNFQLVTEAGWSKQRSPALKEKTKTKPVKK